MLVSKKKFNEKLEHLLESMESLIDDESDNLKRIEEKKGNCLYCIKELGRIYETTASKALLVDKDTESFNIYIQSYILWEMILELILPV